MEIIPLVEQVFVKKNAASLQKFVTSLHPIFWRNWPATGRRPHIYSARIADLTWRIIYQDKNPPGRRRSRLRACGGELRLNVEVEPNTSSGWLRRACRLLVAGGGGPPLVRLQRLRAQWQCPRRVGGRTRRVGSGSDRGHLPGNPSGRGRRWIVITFSSRKWIVITWGPISLTCLRTNLLWSSRSLTRIQPTETWNVPVASCLPGRPRNPPLLRQ